jgi:hypothetical protein
VAASFSRGLRLGWEGGSALLGVPAARRISVFVGCGCGEAAAAYTREEDAEAGVGAGAGAGAAAAGGSGRLEGGCAGVSWTDAGGATG